MKKYRVEIDTSNTFKSGNFRALTIDAPSVLYHTQHIITTTTAKSPVNGTFRLSYGEEKTSWVSSLSSELQMRNAIEKLIGIDAVSVSRQESYLCSKKNTISVSNQGYTAVVSLSTIKNDEKIWIEGE